MPAPLIWPLPDHRRRLTQRFGENPAYYARFDLAGHEGLDIAAVEGDPVYAAHAGEALAYHAPRSYGTYVQVVGETLLTLYAHLSRALRAGEHVQAGEVIGYAGNTGVSTGPHLHFGVCPRPRDWTNSYKGWVDPLPYLEAGAQDAPVPAARTHTVRRGEYLTYIAAERLGDAHRWGEIATLNAIPFPYVLHVGQVLRLPD
jgi:murein DD-endopeptidase MepM/ murein hydrolase activator NlpD